MIPKNKRDKDNKDNVGNVNLSNRCVETGAQIQHVLQVINLTSGALQGYRHQPFNFFNPESSIPAETSPPFKMTEGQIALEKTLWAACERMEKILNEDSRWNDDFQRKIEKDYDELHQLQMQAIANQQKAALEVTSPHFRYRPDLKRLLDGRWMAILGDPEHLEFAIYGIGDSAQKAIDDFDNVFNHGVPASVAAWCEQREAAYEAGRETNTPFPNQEKTNKKHDDKKVDDTGSGEGPKPSA